MEGGDKHQDRENFSTILEGMVQQKTNQLILAVGEAVHALTPKAKPSLYVKWW